MIPPVDGRWRQSVVSGQYSVYGLGLETRICSTFGRTLSQQQMSERTQYDEESVAVPRVEYTNTSEHCTEHSKIVVFERRR